jgi:hypothetical protein
MLSGAKKFWNESSTTKKVALGIGGALVAGFVGYEAVEAVEGVADLCDGNSFGGGGGGSSFSGGGGGSGGGSYFGGGGGGGGGMSDTEYVPVFLSPAFLVSSPMWMMSMSKIIVAFAPRVVILNMDIPSVLTRTMCCHELRRRLTISLWKSSGQALLVAQAQVNASTALGQECISDAIW